MKILKLLTGALAALALSTSAYADIGTNLIIEEDDPRVSYTGWWLQKENAAAADGEYVVGKASKVSPADPGTMYIDVADADPDQLYRVDIHTLLGETDFRSSDMVINVYHADGVYTGSISIVGNPFEQKGYTTGTFRGVTGIEISNATSDDKHVVIDYVELQAVADPNGGKPNYQSGNVMDIPPTGSAPSEIENIFLLNYETEDFYNPNLQESLSFSGDIIFLNDLDNNGVREFITEGRSIQRFSYDAETYRTMLYIVSMNPNGTVKSYQHISEKSTRGTNLDIFDDLHSNMVLKPIGDMDGNGINDVMIVPFGHSNEKVTILLLEESENLEYKINSVIKYESGSSLTENADIIHEMLFSNYRTVEAYNDVDNNGVNDIVVSINLKELPHYAKELNYLGYSSSTDYIKVLLLIDKDGSIMGLKHFEENANSNGNFRVAGDIDNNGTLDFISNYKLRSHEIILMNSDFTVKGYYEVDFTPEDHYDTHLVAQYIGDINSDSVGDLLVWRDDRTISVVTLNTDMTVKTSTDLATDDDFIGPSWSTYHYVLEDMNTDGILDLLTYTIFPKIDNKTMGNIKIHYMK